MNKDIKRWIDSTSKQFKTTIFYKKDIDIHVIIVPESIEKNEQFRDFSVDFLFDFGISTGEDIIIVSDKDKMYSYKQYDYRTPSYRVVKSELGLFTSIAGKMITILFSNIGSSSTSPKTNGNLIKVNSEPRSFSLDSNKEVKVEALCPQI